MKQHQGNNINHGCSEKEASLLTETSIASSLSTSTLGSIATTARAVAILSAFCIAALVISSNQAKQQQTQQQQQRKLLLLDQTKSITFTGNPQHQPLCHSIQEPNMFFPDFHHGSVVIGGGTAAATSASCCYRIHFRLNRMLAFTRSFIRFHDPPPFLNIVYAIHSHPQHTEQRRMIRETWGKHLFNRYFIFSLNHQFVLTEELQNEFYQYNDIIWIDQLPTTTLVPSWVSMAIIQKRIDTKTFTHLMMIDDQTYVNTHILLNTLLAEPHLEQLLEQHQQKQKQKQKQKQQQTSEEITKEELIQRELRFAGYWGHRSTTTTTTTTATATATEMINNHNHNHHNNNEYSTSAHNFLETPFLINTVSLNCLAEHRVFEQIEGLEHTTTTTTTTTDTILTATVYDMLSKYCTDLNFTSVEPDSDIWRVLQPLSDTNTANENNNNNNNNNNMTDKIVWQFHPMLSNSSNLMQQLHESNLNYMEPKEIPWLP